MEKWCTWKTRVSTYTYMSSVLYMGGSEVNECINVLLEIYGNIHKQYMGEDVCVSVCLHGKVCNVGGGTYMGGP